MPETRYNEGTKTLHHLIKAFAVIADHRIGNKKARTSLPEKKKKIWFFIQKTAANISEVLIDLLVKNPLIIRGCYEASIKSLYIMVAIVMGYQQMRHILRNLKSV